MSLDGAKKLAYLAQNQGIAAVNVIQKRGVKTDEDRYQENVALAIANLSEAFAEFLELQK